MEALNVADHLYEKNDCSYSLFLGHLAIEKLLKGFFVLKKGATNVMRDSCFGGFVAYVPETTLRRLPT
ncbi:MAG: hypothetical protein B1H11_11735 [Desulfobacteraceae bacterium 4484_190.1]|nr:MAG: hypothetical protein B1H11_11735 [Desulfobacteraceae bacterium 4484_190.1]